MNGREQKYQGGGNKETERMWGKRKKKYSALKVEGFAVCNFLLFHA